MAFSKICRICLRVDVRVIVLKNTGLRNLYKTLTNRFMNEEEPIIVCLICHTRLSRCRRLQQQAIESNAVLEQMLAGGSTSIPKPHEARDEVEFTPIYHIDFKTGECNIENDSKDEIEGLDSVKVKEENYVNENSKFKENGNHETETAEKIEELEDDDFGDIHTDSEHDLPLLAFGSMSKRKCKTVELKKERKNNKKDGDDIEQYITPINSFSEPSENNTKSNSTECNINDVRKENLDFESSSIKSNPKVEKDNQLFNKKENHSAKTKNTLVEQSPVPQLTEVYNCDHCEFKTSQKRYILAHFKAHAAKKVYCCNDCDYKCRRKCSLIYHIMKIHTGEKPFSCNICKYKCVKKAHLKDHIKIHSGVKPFSCNICEYKCIQKSNLQTHMKIHTGVKPFSCIICEYKCFTKDNLQTHIKIHTGEKPYSCNICEYKFNTKSNLQRHMKIHTGEKPFLCNICEFRFIRKNHLQNHLKIHTGAKPFSCNICEYKCILKSNMLRHMKIHTGEKPFSCNICKYKCIQKSNLRTHMKIHTEVKPFS